jgi:hypothetical protein
VRFEELLKPRRRGSRIHASTICRLTLTSLRLDAWTPGLARKETVERLG